jgi:predicted Zn finger-like uncharacterized protein
MLIVCPSCATSYEVELGSLSPNGRQVRCARCRSVWRAEPNHADKLLLAAAALAPGAEDEGAGETISGSVDEFADAGVSSDWSTGPEDAAPSPDLAEAVSIPANAPGGEDQSAAISAPPIVPVDFYDSRSSISSGGDYAGEEALKIEDIESAAARRQQRRSRGLSLRWPLSPIQSGILGLLLVDILLVGWRSDVVRALPQTASFFSMLHLPVNLRELTFDNVATSMEQHEGVPILVVEGNVVNATRKPEDVPRLKFVVRNAARQEIYAWTAVPARASLAPGEALGFRTRLASPPATAHDLVVRFVNRRDIIAGSR